MVDGSLSESALFALPESPMTQPWAAIAGNTISALIGVVCFHLIEDPVLALPAAALSLLGMFIFRCLHPPAAAVALIVVLGRSTLI